jgi:hypothetical protein
MKVIFSKYARQELDDATQYYEIESNHVFIIAVAHQHRKPDY